MKRLLRWLWENLFCRFFHRGERCYPEVWKTELGGWHCIKCHPCGEELDIFMKQGRTNG